MILKETLYNLRRSAAVAVCLVSVVLMTTAQTSDTALRELDTEISAPKVEKRASQYINEYMQSVKSTLNRNGMEANLVRNGEVVEVVIPCEKMFAPNSVEIKPSGEGYLRFFTSLLKYPDMYKIIVAVHSDNTGEPAYCVNLTEQRAEAIDECLCRASGTSGENLYVYGLGSIKPLAPDNRSIEHRARNRRIEIYIVPGNQMVDLASAGRLRY